MFKKDITLTIIIILTFIGIGIFATTSLNKTTKEQEKTITYYENAGLFDELNISKKEKLELLNELKYIEAEETILLQALSKLKSKNKELYTKYKSIKRGIK